MPCIITGGKQAAVIMSLEDYQSMEETLYLLGNPNNAKRLLQSLDQLGTPATRERDLLP